MRYLLQYGSPSLVLDASLEVETLSDTSLARQKAGRGARYLFHWPLGEVLLIIILILIGIFIQLQQFN